MYIQSGIKEWVAEENVYDIIVGFLPGYLLVTVTSTITFMVISLN